MILNPRSSMLSVMTCFTLVVSACSSGSDGVADAGDASVEAAAPVLAEDADMIPCGPRAVLQAICQTCHSRPPREGAPFPLVTRSNIVGTAADGRQLRELMIEQLEAKRMPLPPVTIEDDRRAVLLDWLRAGAPAIAAQECSDAGAPADASADALVGN